MKEEWEQYLSYRCWSRNLVLGFNAFADKSEAAKESLELDDKTFGDIIKEEIDRINEKYNQGNLQIKDY